MIYFAVILFLIASRVDGRPRRYTRKIHERGMEKLNKKIVKIAHALLTAGLLEREMRKIRVKEWTLRDQISEVDKKLAQLK